MAQSGYALLPQQEEDKGKHRPDDCTACMNRNCALSVRWLSAISFGLIVFVLLILGVLIHHSYKLSNQQKQIFNHTNQISDQQIRQSQNEENQSAQAKNFSDEVKVISANVQKLKTNVEEISGETAREALHETVVLLEVFDLSTYIVQSAGMGQFVMVFGEYLIVTAAHVVRALLNRTTGLVMMASNRNGKPIVLTGRFWMAKKGRPDVAFLELKVSSMFQSHFLKLSSNAMKEGDTLYWEGSYNHRPMIGKCDVIARGIEPIARFHTTCPGAPGSSGMGYVNGVGELVGVHHGAADLESDPSTMEQEIEIGREMWDVAWEECVRVQPNCSCASPCYCGRGETILEWNCSGPCSCLQGCHCNNEGCMCDWSDPRSSGGPCNCTNCVLINPMTNTPSLGPRSITDCECDCRCQPIPGMSGLCFSRFKRAAVVAARNPRTAVDDVTWVSDGNMWPSPEMTGHWFT